MDADFYQRVIQACFPAFSVRSVVFFAEGWSSSVWEVNGSHVFRFPKRPEIDAGLHKEIRLLPALAPVLPLPVPRFEYAWLGGPEYRGIFVGYPKLPGVPMMREHLASLGSMRPSRQLAEFLTSLHRFPRQQAVALGIADGSPTQWRDRYVAFYETACQRVFPLLRALTRRHIAAAWEDFLEDEAKFTPRLIHADLNSEHILFDTERGCITGVIDWEDTTIGDPALDFTGLAGYGWEFVRQVLAAYDGPVGEGIIHRAHFYDAIAPCYEVLFGLDVGLPQHVSSGLASLEAVWPAGL